MFWTVLAVGLGAHGWWSGSWIEIGFGVVAGVIGVRRAVMQWDKPGAFANCVATIVAFGFLIVSMIADDNEQAGAWQKEHVPVVAQESAPGVAPQVTVPAPPEPPHPIQLSAPAPAPISREEMRQIGLLMKQAWDPFRFDGSPNGFWVPVNTQSVVNMQKPGCTFEMLAEGDFEYELRAGDTAEEVRQARGVVVRSNNKDPLRFGGVDNTKKQMLAVKVLKGEPKRLMSRSSCDVAERAERERAENNAEMELRKWPNIEYLSKVASDNQFSDGALLPGEEAFVAGDDVKIELDGNGRSKEFVFDNTNDFVVGSCTVSLDWVGTLTSAPDIEVQQANSDGWTDYIGGLSLAQMWSVHKMRIMGVSGKLKDAKYRTVCKRKKAT